MGRNTTFDLTSGSITHSWGSVIERTHRQVPYCVLCSGESLNHCNRSPRRIVGV